MVCHFDGSNNIRAFKLKVGLGSTVLINGLQSGQLDGIGHYCEEMFNQLNKLNRNILLHPVFFGKPPMPDLKGLVIESFPKYSSSALWSTLSSSDFFKTKSLQNDLDIFHATDHCTPRFSHLPVVATFMDAIPLSHPHWVNQRARWIKNLVWRKSAQWADHLITISEFSKKEISHHFRVDENNITVIPLGVDERYFVRLGQDVIDSHRQRLKLPERFFLFIGTLQPRKNLDRMIDAHEALPAHIRKEVPLLIVGRNGWGSEQCIQRLNAYGQGGAVRWLQNVNDVSKRVMLQSATALVFPSLLEGFGLPVLEGFASQTPVMTSNLSSLPEVAGDAAWLVDPYKVAEMTEAMATLAQDETVGREFVAKGLVRARKFTWQACAQETIKVYERVLNTKTPHLQQIDSHLADDQLIDQVGLDKQPTHRAKPI